MSYYSRLTLELRWISKVSFVLLLIVSILGTPFGIIDSSKPDSNDIPYSVDTQSLVSPEFADTSFLSSDYPEVNTTTSLGLQSTIERFVNTSWNIKSEESIRLEENNDTIDWPEPIPQINRNVVNTSIDLNSSLSISSINNIDQSLPLYIGDSTGTILFDDDCSSTSGWISQSSWPSEPPLTQLQTGIDLLVSNGRHKSGDIPALSSVYMHGPMWTKTLVSPASVGEGLNLEVILEHEFNWNKMGDVGVVIYDMNDEIIFRVWVHDAWYGTRSDVYVGYYFLDWQGGGASKQSVQLSSDWSGTLKIWFDKDSDSVKATVPGGSFTLVTDPSEEELNRYAKTVAIYFGRNRDWNYESKFIDSIYLSVDTDPDTAFEAYPLTPAMDGHWFPQAPYSRLYFQVNQPYNDYLFHLRIKIDADHDIRDRTLTVRVDGIVCYSNTISDETGFDGVVSVLGSGARNVEIEILWGGYLPKGWKLLHFYPERTNGEPLEVVGEYFPQTSIAQLSYLARLGSDSKINLKLEADQDPTPRTIRVYVDGQLKHSGTGDSAWEWSLGNYPDNSVHEVVVELEYGGFAEWGKKLTINRVHHFKGGVEVDYMAGHAPAQEDLDVLEAYFILLGYERTEFHLDDEVPHVDIFDLSTDGIVPSSVYWSYSNPYRDHTYDPKWEWMLCLHYFSWNGMVNLGVNGLHWGGYGIIIHDQVILDHWWFLPVTPSRRTVMLHEYGHHIGIIDWNPDKSEKYCVNYQCAMAQLNHLNARSYPFYCAHHWSEHRWPGW